MIHRISPSALMQSTHERLRGAIAEVADNRLKDHRKGPFSIESERVDNLPAYSVINAQPHTDKETHPWTAVWVLCADYHWFFVRHARWTRSKPLATGTVYLFRCHFTHWTEDGVGPLVFCALDFQNKPDDSDVLRRYEGFIRKAEKAA